MAYVRPQTTTFAGSENFGVEIGQNSGPVQVTINSQGHTTTNEPRNICNIPDLLSPHFVGRETELAEIQDAFEKEDGESPARCIVYGMHGVGKTQLALKYAERSWEEKRCPYIFWMSAASVDKVVEGFSKLLDLIGLAECRTMDQSARCTAARGWLENRDSQTKRRWLLALDNTSPEAVQLLRELLPRDNGGGRILLTTRTKQTAEALAAAYGKRHVCIGLTPLGVHESVQLLLRDYHISDDDQTNNGIQAAEYVVKSVGCLPLAVDQAASLMEVSGNTAQDIAQIYQSDQVEDVLEWENDLSRYEESSVIATYTWTLEQIKQSPAGTSDFLRILAFIDPESVPIEMFKHGCGDSTDEDLKTVRRLLENTVLFQKAVQRLQSLSLVTQQRDGKMMTLRIHDLVQLVLRTKLFSSGDERRQWLGHAIRIVCKSFERIDDPQSPKCWEDCERFVAHGQALQRHSDWFKLTDEELLTMRSDVAEYLSSRGRYKEAEVISNDVLIRQRLVLGLEHADTVASMLNLSTTYRNQGRWKEAEELQIQVMKIRQRVFGDEHPATLNSMSDLALTYWNQGQWTEAEELEVQVLETSQRLLGDEHPVTRNSTAHLAATYWNQGRWKESEELQIQVMKIRQRVLGDEHPATLSSMNNLTLAYRYQGRLKEAEELGVHVMEACKKVLGDEHPYTLSCKNNLAITYRDQGRCKEAEELGLQAMEVRKRTLGAEHPATLTSMANLAMVYYDQGQFTEAEELEAQVLETRKTVLGNENPATLNSMANLASTYREQGRLKEAEELQDQVTDIRKKVFGAKNPVTLSYLMYAG